MWSAAIIRDAEDPTTVSPPRISASMPTDLDNTQVEVIQSKGPLVSDA